MNELGEINSCGKCKRYKEVIIDICYQEGITRRDLIAVYNKKYNKNLLEQTFTKTLSNNNIKFNMLVDLLDSIGYTIDIRKKIIKRVVFIKKTY